jgi:hypothetical protein
VLGKNNNNNNNNNDGDNDDNSNNKIAFYPKQVGWLKMKLKTRIRETQKKDKKEGRVRSK